MFDIGQACLHSIKRSNAKTGSSHFLTNILLQVDSTGNDTDTPFKKLLVKLEADIKEGTLSKLEIKDLVEMDVIMELDIRGNCTCIWPIALRLSSKTLSSFSFVTPSAGKLKLALSIQYILARDGLNAIMASYYTEEGHQIFSPLHLSNSSMTKLRQYLKLRLPLIPDVTNILKEPTEYRQSLPTSCGQYPHIIDNSLSPLKQPATIYSNYTCNHMVARALLQIYFQRRFSEHNGLAFELAKESLLSLYGPYSKELSVATLCCHRDLEEAATIVSSFHCFSQWSSRLMTAGKITELQPLPLPLKKHTSIQLYFKLLSHADKESLLVTPSGKFSIDVQDLKAVLKADFFAKSFLCGPSINSSNVRLITISFHQESHSLMILPCHRTQLPISVNKDALEVSLCQTSTNLSTGNMMDIDSQTKQTASPSELGSSFESKAGQHVFQNNFEVLQPSYVQNDCCSLTTGGKRKCDHYHVEEGKDVGVEERKKFDDPEIDFLQEEIGM